VSEQHARADVALSEYGFQKRSRIGYSERRAVVVGSAAVDHARRPTTTMIIIGIILGFVGHPRCRTHRFYDAPITPYARSDLALPAAVAGYHAALGLAHLGVPAEGWRQAIAVAGAIIVAATAWARMALAAPRPTPDKALPPA
jgi:hypothetical protein